MKKMIVQNLFNKDNKDVKSSEDFSQSKTSDESNIRESLENGTSISNYDSSTSIEENSDVEEYQEKLYAKQIRKINDKFDAHGIILENIFDKVNTEISTLRNNSVKYIETERDDICKDLESLKKKMDEAVSTKWMTKEENDRILAEIEKQNEELRKEIIGRGITLGLELDESEGGAEDDIAASESTE